MTPISEDDAIRLPPDSFNARLIIDYLNHQLHVHHANTQFKRINQSSFDYYVHNSLAYAWESFACKQKGSGSTLHFTFGTPELRFICDHDALLELTVQEVTSDDDSVEDMSEALRGAKLAYRVTTTRRTIVGNDFTVGDHESRINLLVCDLEYAELIHPRNEDIVITDGLQDLLGLYLNALQLGGHHVFFFPPQFDEADYYRPPRLSLASDYVELTKQFGPSLTTDIQGFSEARINAHFSLTWGACMFAAREHRSPLRWNSASALAEYQTWLFEDLDSEIEWHSSMKFREPRVTILCAREIVLYFTLSEVRFYEARSNPTGLPEKDHPDNETPWVIALIVDVQATKDSLRIIAETARYSEEFSEITGLNEEHKDAYSDLTEFFVRRYIKLIASRRIAYRFRDDYSVISTAGFDDGSWWMLERESGTSLSVFSSTIKHTRMEGFDVVIAISQTTINSQFTQLFKGYHSELSVRDQLHYKVEVKTITVQLLQPKGFQESGSEALDESDQAADDEEATTNLAHSRAVVTVHVSSGSLHYWLDEDFEKISRPDHISGKVGEWRLAFEVDLAMCYNDELPEWRYRHQPFVYPPPPGEDSYRVRHVYLDLQNARFSPRYSTMEDWEYGIPNVIRARMTLAQFIKDDYFPLLIEKSVHIIASIPIFKPGSSSTFYKLTDITCRTYAVESKRADEGDSASYSEQLLFILGMTGYRSLPDITRFIPSTQWLLRGRFSHGTLAISKSTFRERLHALLGNINALTTLVHNSSASYMIKDVVQRWADHPDYRKKPSEWMPVNGTDSRAATKFAWHFENEMHLKQGTQLITHRNYEIECSTHNELELSDVSMLSTGSLEIRIAGVIRLRMYSSRADSSWETESSVPWNVIIRIKTAAHGNVEVDIDGVDNLRPTPPKSTIRSGGANVPNMQATLRHHLPRRKDFEEVMKELKVLQGVWRYYYPATTPFTLCTPMLNNDGDFLFELRRSQTDVSQRVGRRRGRVAKLTPTTPTTPTSAGSSGPDGYKVTPPRQASNESSNANDNGP
ncbi:hypothetical protein BD310DRAFT_980934 [Dichomitus squalens]|uniref:Uncharacterized protein n=1 Tax=Dichomitus squalens TaxID=114155 RepID=A0A4Q9PFC2_9APHY|nr:hypothetical protein BD310DRAFT_980934 [Dichomitus squalens]